MELVLSGIITFAALLCAHHVRVGRVLVREQDRERDRE